MRSPSAVDIGGANSRQALTLRNRFTNAQAFQRLLAQVAVKSKKAGSIIRGVLQDDDRPVVQGCFIVGEDVNGAGQWGVDRGAGLGKEIDTQMDHAALIGQTRPGGKERGSIEQARLIIAAHCKLHARRLHHAE